MGLWVVLRDGVRFGPFFSSQDEALEFINRGRWGIFGEMLVTMARACVPQHEHRPDFATPAHGGGYHCREDCSACAEERAAVQNRGVVEL